jgi:hypothetical protein
MAHTSDDQPRDHDGKFAPSPTSGVSTSSRDLLASAPIDSVGWGDDDRFPVSDWRDEVTNGATRLGYSEWLAHRREAEGGPFWDNDAVQTMLERGHSAVEIRTWRELGIDGDEAVDASERAIPMGPYVERRRAGETHWTIVNSYTG